MYPWFLVNGWAVSKEQHQFYKEKKNNNSSSISIRNKQQQQLQQQQQQQQCHQIDLINNDCASNECTSPKMNNSVEKFTYKCSFSHSCLVYFERCADKCCLTFCPICESCDMLARGAPSNSFSFLHVSFQASHCLPFFFLFFFWYLCQSWLIL